jgi:hypothetical protein
MVGQGGEVVARTGRPRLYPRIRPIEQLEAFCCLQVVRVEQTLNNRYGQDTYAQADGSMKSGGGIRQMPRNDHMAKLTIHRDCALENRK